MIWLLRKYERRLQGLVLIQSYEVVKERGWQSVSVGGWPRCVKALDGMS